MVDLHHLMDVIPYIFKGYTHLIVTPEFERKVIQNKYLEDAMKGHIIAEARLTGTFTP